MILAAEIGNTLILGLLMLTAGINRPGVIDNLGKLLIRDAGENPTRITFVIMLAARLISSFISNTAATGALIPISIGLACKAHLSMSRILMPIAFASILRSSVTLDIKVAEAIVLLHSPLVGRTVKGTRFRERYGVQILAVNRHGETIQQKISAVLHL